jgi:hypothetical protein
VSKRVVIESVIGLVMDEIHGATAEAPDDKRFQPQLLLLIESCGCLWPAGALAVQRTIYSFNSFSGSRVYSPRPRISRSKIQINTHADQGLKPTRLMLTAASVSEEYCATPVTRANNLRGQRTPLSIYLWRERKRWRNRSHPVTPVESGCSARPRFYLRSRIQESDT